MNGLVDPIIFHYPEGDIEFLKSIWKIRPDLTGIPEMWVPITKYAIPEIRENSYLVSNYGRVFSLLRNTFSKPVETDNGYFRVFLCHDDGKRLYHLLHRIVLMSFLPIINPELLQVNHKDGNKSHNWLWNLEWTTCSENRVHAINMGLVKVNGEEHPMHIVSEATADRIGYLLSTSNMTASQIAEFVGNGATESIVYNIMNGCSWPNIYIKYNLSSINRNPKVTTDAAIHKMCEFFEKFKKSGGTIGFGKRIFILREALGYSGVEITESTLRLAERLYYKLTHKDICSMYDY